MQKVGKRPAKGRSGQAHAHAHGRAPAAAADCGRRQLRTSRKGARASEICPQVLESSTLPPARPSTNPPTHTHTHLLHAVPQAPVAAKAPRPAPAVAGHRHCVVMPARHARHGLLRQRSNWARVGLRLVHHLRRGWAGGRGWVGVSAAVVGAVGCSGVRMDAQAAAGERPEARPARALCREGAQVKRKLRCVGVGVGGWVGERILGRWADHWRAHLPCPTACCRP